MTITSFHSALDELNSVIETQNPFINRGAAVKIQDVWGQGFPDIASLNAHASDAVFQAIKQVSEGHCKVTSIAIKAEQGVGKTHIISRIRNRLKAEGGALFVYVSASKINDLDRIQYQFLQILGDSLSQIGSKGVKQWQELATAMLNQAADSEKTVIETMQKRFPSWLNKYGMDKLTQAVLKNKPQIGDPDLIRAILWTLSPVQSPYAIKWLSGNDLSEAKAAELGLPNPDRENREIQAFASILQILSLISDHSALIICFDELEGVKVSESGFTKSQVVAELVKNLFDSLNLAGVSRGVVLLTVMLPDTWTLKIKPMSGGISYRVSTATKDPIELKHMDGDSIVDLVKLWLAEFYESRSLVPPHPVYPFEQNQLRELGKEKPTVRQILNWCAENFKANGGQPAINPVEVAFKKEMAEVEASINTLLDNEAILAEALWLSFSTVIGQTSEQVQIEEIAKVKPKSYINFKIIGQEKGKPVKIGVAVLQQSSGNSVQAILKQLIDYKKFDLTRGCLVRSKEISRSASKAQQYLKQLLSPEFGGEWVRLRSEDIKNILAILLVYNSREDYEVSEEQIFDFMAQNKLAVDNYIIREILSDPSGQVPTDLVDEDKVAYSEPISETIAAEDLDSTIDNLLADLAL